MWLEKKINKMNLHGFSLVELLVAMAMTGVVMAAVFKVYKTQQDSYLAQEQVAEMQQNSRRAKYIMAREIRMAGYDPTAAGAVFGFVSAYGDKINITMDISFEDGAITVPGDDITYSVSDCKLKRNEGNGDQVVVENIEAVGFAYGFDEDEDGEIETSEAGNTIWAIDSDPMDTDKRLNRYLDTNDDGIISVEDDAAGAELTTPVPLDRIRAVKIWILARTGRPDKNFFSSSTYALSDQRVLCKDGHRRYLLTTTVKCRNMPL
jgi:type IV pilus assembly protein PilW